MKILFRRIFYLLFCVRFGKKVENLFVPLISIILRNVSCISGEPPIYRRLLLFSGIRYPLGERSLCRPRGTRWASRIGRFTCHPSAETKERGRDGSGRKRKGRRRASDGHLHTDAPPESFSDKKDVSLYFWLSPLCLLSPPPPPRQDLHAQKTNNDLESARAVAFYFFPKYTGPFHLLYIKHTAKIQMTIIKIVGNK